MLDDVKRVAKALRRAMADSNYRKAGITAIALIIISFVGLGSLLYRFGMSTGMLVTIILLGLLNSAVVALLIAQRSRADALLSEVMQRISRGVHIPENALPPAIPGGLRRAVVGLARLKDRDTEIATAIDRLASGEWMVSIPTKIESDGIDAALRRLVLTKTWEEPLNLADRKWGARAQEDQRLVVSVDSLHTRLHFAERLAHQQSSRQKALAEWKMEVDDAPVFRYIYRNFRPLRHLEFGTWQGVGTTYLLEECDASIWTINLPFGEGDQDRAGYSYSEGEAQEIVQWSEKVGIDLHRKGFRSDSLGFIGRHYIEKGLGNRVCQVYCNSSEWDTGAYPPGFFDSVLIDGGHTSDIVINDTRTALPLLRSGGLLLWHDFCPDRRTLLTHESTRGVFQAIEENWEWLGTHLQDLFWIKPSWILLGVKR